ncbi:MAG: AIR synthase-related protein, partial [Candidatus Marinimicrobia bacterium]|nr:AIR synthase-related protein [Candidatus Neomarinimicrobiota bacterium]
HRSYLPIIKPFLGNTDLHGISHITGGGIEGNTSRILPDGTKLEIDWDAWKWLPIFSYIQSLGNIATEEMRRVFNLGIGLILIVEKYAVSHFVELLKKSGEDPVILGLINN